MPGLEAGGQQVTLLSHHAAITDATGYPCTNFVAFFVSSQEFIDIFPDCVNFSPAFLTI